MVFLGHKWSNGKLEPDDSKFKIIRDFKAPTTQKQIKSCLGVTGYWRRFIKNYSQIASPLRELLNDGVKFVWSEKCEKAFETLKEAIISKPVLALPDFNKPFILTTDASTHGFGYVLSQRNADGHEQPVCYSGRALTNAEKNYSVTDLEVAALVGGVKEFHVYLADKEFEIFTDHISATFLNTMKLSGNNRLARAAIYLQGYKFKISYKKGSTNNVAD